MHIYVVPPGITSMKAVPTPAAGSAFDSLAQVKAEFRPCDQDSLGWTRYQVLAWDLQPATWALIVREIAKMGPAARRTFYRTTLGNHFGRDHGQAAVMWNVPE